MLNYDRGCELLIVFCGLVILFAGGIDFASKIGITLLFLVCWVDWDKTEGEK